MLKLFEFWGAHAAKMTLITTISCYAFFLTHNRLLVIAIIRLYMTHLLDDPAV